MAAHNVATILTVSGDESKLEQQNGDDVIHLFNDDDKLNIETFNDRDLPAIKIFSSSYQETLDEKGWLNVGKLPNHLLISNVVRINNNEFVVSTNTTRYNSEYAGIWAYNVNKKHWKYVWEYDKKIIDEIKFAPFMVYNPNKLELYIYSREPDILFRINVLNGNHYVCNRNIFDMDYSMESMIYCNDYIHLISSKKHIIWSCIGSSMKNIDTFTKCINGPDRELFSVVHLKKQNCIWLVGGMNTRDGFDDINQFDLNKFEWKKLTNITLPKKFTNVSCVMSTDDRYLIIMNGDQMYGENHDIYFLDFNDIDMIMKWQKSKIKIAVNDFRIRPILFDQTLSAKKMDLFLNGLLRRLSILLFIPYDMILLIKKMYSNEILHLVKYAQRKVEHTDHYTISFEKLLNTN